MEKLFQVTKFHCVRFAGGCGGKLGEEGKREEAFRRHDMRGTREFILMVPAGWGNFECLKEFDIIFSELRIGRDDANMLDDALRNDKPVEWITMMLRKRMDHFEMLYG